MAKFTVCISSVIEREQGFPDYRYIAKSVIDHMGHQAVRNPEDVHTQYNFERVLNEECDFFVLIVGNTESTMVERELKIALARGIPILAFAKIHYNSQGKSCFQPRESAQSSRFRQNCITCKLQHSRHAKIWPVHCIRNLKMLLTGRSN